MTTSSNLENEFFHYSIQCPNSDSLPLTTFPGDIFARLLIEQQNLSTVPPVHECPGKRGKDRQGTWRRIHRKSTASVRCSASQSREITPIGNCSRCWSRQTDDRCDG